MGLSGKVYLRMGKKHCVTAAGEMREKHATETTVSEEGGGATEQALQPLERNMMMQVVLLQAVEDHVGADNHTAAHGYGIKEAAALGAYMGAGTVGHEGLTPEWSVPDGLYHMRGTSCWSREKV